MTHRKISKKAQAEAFGLIIVIVLLLVGVLIFAKLESGKNDNIRETYEVSAISSNTINTFLNTNIGGSYCSQKTYSDAFVACLKDESATCNGVNYCSIFMNDIDSVLGKVIVEKLSMEYVLSVDSTLDIPNAMIDPLTSENGCGTDLAGEEFKLPLHPGQGTGTIKLIICYS